MTFKLPIIMTLGLILSSCGEVKPEEDSSVSDVEVVSDDLMEAKPTLCSETTALVNSCNSHKIFLSLYEIRDDLYWVNDVGLAFKAKGAGFSYDARIDPKMGSEELMTFETVFQPITGDDNIENVIDVKSWRGGGIFYRDDFNFYCHHIMSDGGRLGHYKEFNPNELQFLLNDGRLIPWADTEGQKWRQIEGFHGDYLTDGEKVIDFRCGVKSIEEHKKLVAERNAREQ